MAANRYASLRRVQQHSPIHDREKRDLFRWLYEVAAHSKTDISPETVDIAKQLLQKCCSQEPALSVDQLETYLIGCMFVSHKYNEQPENQMYVDEFLEWFNPREGKPRMTVADMLRLERDILRRVGYRIPNEYDPFSTLYDFTSVEDFLTKTTAAAKITFLQNLTEHDRYIEDQTDLVRGSKFISYLRVTAVNFMVCQDEQLACLWDRALCLAQQVSKHEDYGKFDPFFYNIGSLFLLAINKYSEKDWTAGNSVLSTTVKLCKHRQLSVSCKEPLNQLLYYPSLASWFRHSSREQQSLLLRQLRRRDIKVQEQNKTPATVLSRLSVLTMILMISLKRRADKQLLLRLYRAVELVAQSKEWYQLSFELLPDAKRLCDIMLTPLSQLLQQKKEIQEEVYSIFWHWVRVKQLNLLTNGCY